MMPSKTTEYIFSGLTGYSSTSFDYIVAYFPISYFVNKFYAVCLYCVSSMFHSPIQKFFFAIATYQAKYLMNTF